MGKRRNARRNKMKSDRSIRRGLHEAHRGTSPCPSEFLSSVEKPRGPRLVFRLSPPPSYLYFSRVLNFLQITSLRSSRILPLCTAAYETTNEDDKRLTRLLPNEFLCFILSDVVLPLISLRCTTIGLVDFYAFMRHLRDIYATFNDAKARKEYMQKRMCTIHRRKDWNYVIEITLRTTVIFQIHKFLVRKIFPYLS